MSPVGSFLPIVSDSHSRAKLKLGARNLMWVSRVSDRDPSAEPPYLPHLGEARTWSRTGTEIQTTSRCDVSIPGNSSAAENTS